MKRKNTGVQKRIADLNPLALFVPCGCHSYNLVLCDADHTWRKTERFQLHCYNMVRCSFPNQRCEQSKSVAQNQLCPIYSLKNVAHTWKITENRLRSSYCNSNWSSVRTKCAANFQTQTLLRRVKRRPGWWTNKWPQKKFETQFFNALLDTVLMSMRERFRQLQDFSVTWSFLFNIKKY